MTGPAPLRMRRMAQTRREISDVALDLFISEGLSETSVARIASSSGVSPRTFHRLFVSKEEAIAPILDEGWQIYVDAVAAQSSTTPIVDALINALVTAFDGPQGRRHRDLLRALPRSPTLAPVWESVHARSANALRPVLAERLGIESECSRAHFAAACVVAANRIAVEEWVGDEATSVADLARDCLDRVSMDLLAQPQVERSTTPRRTR
ncbi:TetR/AcrR family transcriptional regulator [Gordonia sp. NPDC003425]